MKDALRLVASQIVAGKNNPNWSNKNDLCRYLCSSDNAYMLLQKQIINENNMLDILHGRNAILQKQIVNENNILEILHEQDEKLVVILSGVEDNMNNINLNISEINKKFNVLNKKHLKLEARIVNIEKNLRM